MEQSVRPGGCLPGLPLKLALVGEEAPALPGDTLTVTADCAALLQKEWDAAAVTVCPRLTEDMAAPLRALAEAGSFSRVRVIAPDTPCCAVLAERVARALPELDMERANLPTPEDTPEKASAPVPEKVDIAPIREDPVHASLPALRFYSAAAFSPEAETGVAVALARHFPTEADMAIAAKNLRRETVFVRPEEDGTLTVRAFSPAGEHQPGPGAILAAAVVLRDRERQLWSGTYNVRTRAGFVQLNLGEELAWIEQAAGPLVRMLEESEGAALYAALGLEVTATEIRPCLAGDAVALLEFPAGEELAVVSPRAELAGVLETMNASGVCLYHRTGEGETALCRSFDRDGKELSPGKGAGLLGWWLPLLRRAGAECVFREGNREYRTFTGPDGRLFLGGTVATGDQPVRGETLR